MNILDIKSICSLHKMSDRRDLLDYQKINNVNLGLLNEEIISKMANGYPTKANVTVKYFNGKIYTEDKEYSAELITLDNETKRRIENSNEPLFLNGILKYNLIKEKYILTNFTEIEFSFELDSWTSILSQLSFNEIITEVLAGLNMNASKLSVKEKHIFLARLIPLVQKQYLLIDFSKRSTRKTRTYLDLGYHIPAAYNFTRAKIIYDQSQRKQGLIFNTKDDCLILDEFQNNNDDGITMGIQQYKNDGTISDDKGNIMSLNTSIIILGNPKVSINYPFLFRNEQNLFDGTTICKKNTSTGDAFLSRGDYFIPSWGSRVISNEMILDSNVKRIPPYILRSVFNQLREIDISNKVKIIIRDFKFKIDTQDIRSQRAIERTFEGLIKLLLPQLIRSDNYQDYQKELQYLYNLSLEGRIIINNMLQKIKPENIPTNFHFSTASYFDEEKNVFVLPHRKITIRDNEVIKEALDSIGILQNQKEISILRKYKVKYCGDDLCFKHPCSLSNLFKRNIFNEIKDKCKEHKKSILGISAIFIGSVVAGYTIKKAKIKPILKEIGQTGISEAINIVIRNNKRIIGSIIDTEKSNIRDTDVNLWSTNIFFNYLLGEYENIPYSKKDMNNLESISFYYK